MTFAFFVCVFYVGAAAAFFLVCLLSCSSCCRATTAQCVTTACWETNSASVATCLGHGWSRNVYRTREDGAFYTILATLATPPQVRCAMYVILKHLQALAGVGKPFAHILSAFTRKRKKNHNPFALFVMDSQVFATVCWHSYGIHKALLFSVLLRTNHIIFGDFAANFKFSYSQGYSLWCESSIKGHDMPKQKFFKGRYKYLRHF